MPSRLKTINVRVDEDTYNTISEVANLLGVSRASLVRSALENNNKSTDGLREKRLESNKTNELYTSAINKLNEIERDLKGVANNINQLTKKVNSQNRADGEDMKFLKECFEDIKNTKKALDDLSECLYVVKRSE